MARGRYAKLEPVITEMYLVGISPEYIAKALNINQRTLEVRIGEWGLFEIKKIEWELLAKNIKEKHAALISQVDLEST